MRYILTLFLIVLASSSQIINKDDEIKEFAEYEDVELQLWNTIISIIKKACPATISLCHTAKVKYFSTKKKISEILKGRKYFKNIQDTFRYITRNLKVCKNSSLINNSTIDKKTNTIDKKTNTIDKVKLSIIYKNYQKIKATYNKCKIIYEEANKNYTNIGLISGRQQEYQKQEQNRTQEFQDQQQKLQLQRLKRTKAFQRYGELRNNNTMNLSENQVEINNHLNYMLNNGFITPVQKQQMSNIIPPEQRK